MKDVKRISPLAKSVAGKIAAGEVVDRPISIVKELVENSLDAGADSLIIEIKNGGKTYIRITDNGSGIHKDDIELAFQRHATSKIREASDLDHITSLGFRGEALASIAAVSNTELITKTQDSDTAICIKLRGGEPIEKNEIGSSDGTTIIITDLFYNTPARLKFLKSDGTESTLIIDFISKIALAYPSVKIRLINNGNILFSTPGKGDIYTSILTIYSKEVAEHLLSFEERNETMSMSAFISKPDYTKTNRKSQIFFVNGRYITSKVLDQSVKDSYAEKLFEGRYPIVFLFLNIPPDRLDVNIHPNKKEVRFADERAVREFIYSAIRRHLNTKEAMPEVSAKNLLQGNVSSENPKSIPSSTIKSSSSSTEYKTSAVKSYQPPAKEDQIDIKKILETRRKEKKDGNISYESREGKGEGNDFSHLLIREEAPMKQYDVDLSRILPTGSVFGTYITAADEEFFYLIDQHAAHERIFYEKLMEQQLQEKTLQQSILEPIVLSVSYATMNEAQAGLPFLQSIGYEIEEFGKKEYIVKGIPMFMALSEAQEFLYDFFDNLEQGASFKDKKKMNRLITDACKSAVKAHDVLDMVEIKQLLKDLAKCNNPYSCPHGRPVFVKMSKREIEKLFKRV